MDHANKELVNKRAYLGQHIDLFSTYYFILFILQNKSNLKSDIFILYKLSYLMHIILYSLNIIF